MGNPSDLRFVPSSCATTPIDWTKVPEASKKFLLEGWGEYFEEDPDYDDEDEDYEGDGGTVKTRPLPATIEDLAKMFDESKFFGYMKPELCTLLLDISEFGLAEPRLPTSNTSFGLSVGPRFYMKYIYQVWVVLFTPGSRHAVTCYSPRIPPTEDAFEEAGIARDRAVAEEYDAKLCEEVSRLGTLEVVARQKLAGWEGSTLKGNMEYAQLTNAIMGLPHSHPAYVAMAQHYGNLWRNP
ncbi:hypothetical protein K443DRAFT_307464 [Laccaria amethystina LaAM-08-1]|jgi:hypothetical protein|uniref:Unplaced genomic scaffold K443scaffold_20, whole genome shotgun sequence n=1 Tax=Laccaria amethystina LaAM-08-1 TaxID=1095629 RepID=A0A0C9XWT1_9AGAR|nr:hypothetical protein K443DRAFT_307464 [Laccaria amethystina LaAM-08-1]